jgi:hypothetical protein
MKLVLSRVEKKDFEKMIPVQFEAFSNVDIHHCLFSRSTAENHALGAKRYIEWMDADPADVWLKIMDEDVSPPAFVCASNWKIPPAEEKDEQGNVLPPQKVEITWLEDEQEKEDSVRHEHIWRANSLQTHFSQPYGLKSFQPYLKIP